MNDAEAYRKYPHLTHWYNKLWFSKQMGYNCGPGGVSPDESGWYIIRPVINLFGMGVGTKKVWVEKGDVNRVPLGHFWCEWFEGRQYSVTYEWRGYWHALSSFEGVKDHENLSKFHRWERTNKFPKMCTTFDELSNVGRINVEFIENNPIEVHLRTSPDPDYDVLIPIWKDEVYLVDKYEKIGYSYIHSYDDANGFLKKPRLGFMVKNFN